MPRRSIDILIALTVAFAAAPAAFADETSSPAAQDARFAERMADFVSALRAAPDAPPGFALVVVRDDQLLFSDAYGLRDVRSGAPMTLDTPIYTASTTKAFTGLLAAQLDRSGALPLSSSLRDVWPEVALPAPLDPDAVTAERLLSHSSEIFDSGINFLSNVAGTIGPEEVPGHLERYAEPAPNFAYGNFGPFIYSMMIEQRLGVGWRDALDVEVVAPLRLEHTSADLADFDAGEIAYCHRRDGSGWRTVEPKPGVALNAAGGVYASAGDAARFLMAFTSGGRSIDGRISEEVLASTWRPRAEQQRTTWGMDRTGYGLGWDLGRYGDAPVAFRAGYYPGCAAIFAFFPERRLGVAVLALTDMAPMTFVSALVRQSFDYFTGDPEAAARAQERTAQFADAAAAEFREIAAAPAPVATATSEEDLAALAGRYENPRLGTFTVGVEEGALSASLGGFELRLLPTGGDGFAALHEIFHPGFEHFEFRRDAAGRADRLMWDDREFVRISD